MAEISDWSATAGDNNSAPPDGFPEGMAYSDVNNSAREVMAVLARLFGDTNGTLETAGAADAYTLTPNRSILSLSDGLVLRFKVHATNTGASTLNVSGLGDKDIVSPADGALGAGNLTAGGIYEVVYVSAVDKFILVGMATGTLTIPSLTVSGNVTVGGALSGATASGSMIANESDILTGTATDKVPSANAVHDALAKLGGAPHAWFGDEKASGVSGGGTTAGSWQQRDINTKWFDPNSYITISSDQFTVSKSGIVEVKAPGFVCTKHQIRLVDDSDDSVVAVGTTESCGNANQASVSTSSWLVAQVEEGATYRVEHRTSGTRATDGFGDANGFGEPEVYTAVKYWRTA